MATEKRLIDANALRKAIDLCDIDTFTDKQTICEQIAEAPTVDAVEVVRCRDCRNCGEFDHNGVALCYELVRYVYGDYYCADGERRTNEG